MDTWPPAPTGMTARFGTDWPPTKFRFDVVCRAAPVGHAVRYPAAVVLVPVRFITTAATPVAGTGPAPSICTSIWPPGPSGALAAPAPTRVSRTRTGASGTNSPPWAAVAVNPLADPLF